MRSLELLSVYEREAQDEMVDEIIRVARKRGFDLRGVDGPADGVREAIAQWLIDHRDAGRRGPARS